MPAYTAPVNTVPPEYDVNNTTIVVGNLDLNVSEEELKQNFLQFGDIISVKVQAGKGCGFGTRASAEEAIQKMQGKMIGQQVIRISWGRAPTARQESLDNILVELYKRSGRADEEIDMLHHKLKQIEDGVTFVGRTTKHARSQGKKIQITAEQEISRFLKMRRVGVKKLEPMCGSSALPQPVMQEWEAITGHRLLERYGMTEFVMALSNPLKGERKAGTVGKPLPGVQVEILEDEESGSEKTGTGELCVKSPSLFKEYWKHPEVTEESFTDDGFFKSGDAVTTDKDGYYIILGRTNADIIKAGGYKLSALEIESVIVEHPAVTECCVLGLPDKDYGEIVGAIIVPKADVKQKRDEESKPALSLEELSSWAKDKLAPYKIPTRLILWDSLPRNAMGKVNKKELKKLLA